MSDLQKLQAQLAQARTRVSELEIAVRVLTELHEGTPATAPKAAKPAKEGPPPGPLITVKRVAIKERTSQTEGKELRRQLLAHLMEHPEGIATRDLAAAVGMTTQQAGQFLNRMRIEGKVASLAPGLYGPKKNEAAA